MLTLTLAERDPARPLRMLCIGAHCDDIEIGCGGTLLRLLGEHPGTEVRWEVLTSTPEREREARASAAAFGGNAGELQVAIHGFRDGYLPAVWAEAKDTFEKLKLDYAPDLVLTHHGNDAHQDHRTVSQLTWNTFRDHLILEYEVPKYDGDLGQPGCFVPLSDATVDRKVELLTRHFSSQGGRRWFDAETFRALCRLRGIESGAPERYAEGFHVRKIVL